MNVLVVGSGGREHALCWAIAASPLCDKLYCAPGNAGIAREAECVPVAADDLDGLVQFAQRSKIDFVVVGPEQPLVLGLVDRLEAAGIKAFGPTRSAAALEGSKGFMKDFARKAGVPTAAYARFRDPAAARAFAREMVVQRPGAPIVVKADGLAAGKGVTICGDYDAAVAAIDEAMVDRRFGESGTELVLEEFLEGEEVSFFALCDGTTALPFGSAQDHKRVGDGDTGPNTGGMGAYSPAPVMTPQLAERVMREIIRPTVTGMATIGRPFKGVLFAGLMITKDGPKLIEFNVRFGDPECEVLMPRLMSDPLPALIAARDGQLRSFDVRWHDRTALCVIMAARGYPGEPLRGTEINGIGDAEDLQGVTVFHAGTKQQDSKILANGGRVLAVTALANTPAAAYARAYEAVDLIRWPEGFCRNDIGWRAVPGWRKLRGR
ncbi:MAG TPA: phosphoribosylamine--glycine ligase [Alphaproteobacteria bacterium]|nr:phosphoribosylamine--glycine ligase [Alphaproteobacteria bacterium]